MCLDACQVEAGRIWLKEVRTEVEMEVGIEAEIFTQKHMNKNTNYTMNHIQVMTVKCGRIETDQTLKSTKWLEREQNVNSEKKNFLLEYKRK